LNAAGAKKQANGASHGSFRGGEQPAGVVVVRSHAEHLSGAQRGECRCPCPARAASAQVPRSKAARASRRIQSHGPWAASTS